MQKHPILMVSTDGVNLSIPTYLHNISISLNGDDQLNPGPKNKSDIKFSVCHLILNSIAAHNYAKVFLLKAYIAVCKFYIVCISETYLHCNIASDDGNLETSGYNLIRSANPFKVNVMVFVFIIQRSAFNIS